MAARVNLGGERYDGRGVQLRPESVRVPLSFVVAGLMGRWLGRTVGSVARRPWLWTPILVAALLLRAVGVEGLVAALVASALLLVGWSRFHPGSFTRFVRWPARSAFRRVLVYRRGWQPAMVTCGLDVRVVDKQFLPELRRVRSSRTVDRVRVRMLPGQVLEDYAAQAERLAMTLGAVECRVRTGKKHGEVELWFLVDDPLRDLVPVFEPPASTPDYGRLPVALREDGETYRLRLLGNHVLCVGATGSGKGSVLWSLIWSLQSGIRDGSAQLWVLDPKGGMEFANGAPMFERYCYGDTTPPHAGGHAEGIAVRAYELGFARFLEDAVAVMRDRQARLRGVTRLHEPKPGDPLVVVVVDELASLTAYVTDRDAKTRIRAALSLLLSQGRAVGVVVVAALQDPRKDVLPFRDLFPTRIAMRLTEPEQVDMTLGEGARRRGAACDKIPEHLPGIGYVVLDGIAEPIRVRFPHVTDDHITTMAVPDTPADLDSHDPVKNAGRDAA